MFNLNIMLHINKRNNMQENNKKFIFFYMHYYVLSKQYCNDVKTNFIQIFIAISLIYLKNYNYNSFIFKQNYIIQLINKLI